MPRLKKPSTEFSRSLKSQPRPELPESPPKKTSSKKTLAAPILDPSLNGPVLEAKTNPSASASGNSSNLNSLPLPKLKVAQQRSKEALKRLKIKPEELRLVPQFSSTLRLAGGSLNAVMQAILFDNSDPTIRSFLDAYDSIPIGDRKSIPWEAIALKSGVNVQQFVGAAVIALTRKSAIASKIIAVSNHPKVMKATVTYAQYAGGEKDRKMLHEMMGTLPTPKGPTFIGKAIFGSGKSVMESDGDEGGGSSNAPADVFTDDDDFEELFPSAKEIQDKLIPIRQKRLGDGK